MGGLGSGRHWRYGAADCTNDFRQLDVRRWQRDGLLASGQSFSWKWTRNGEKIAWINVRTGPGQVTLSYRQRRNGEEWKNEEYPVCIEWTPCNYGGRRAWFLCPAKGCHRRVAVLYGGAVFACRHCYRLAYPSQRESGDDRMARQAEKIRDRLGWEPGILNGEGGKPKWMRWKTFRRLRAQHEALVHQSLTGMEQRLAMLQNWLR